MLNMDGVGVANRKYLGAKTRLLAFIEEAVLSCVKPKTFIDAFSGTGIVADHFRRFTPQVIANDILVSNYVVNRAFLCTRADNADMDQVTRRISELNRLAPQMGYAYQNYGGSYFTAENAGLIDAVRERVEGWRKELNPQEICLLLTSLVYAADKCANTVGQYDAFLKHIGGPLYTAGSHKVDANVYKRLELKVPRIIPGGRAQVYNADINTLIGDLEGDVLYLDPPYNTRQYVDNYHVLENIVRWDKPPLCGKTSKFPRAAYKSRFSQKRAAAAALRELLGQARSEHIFLSYNNEGILSHSQILSMLADRGPTRVFEADYKIFGNGAGRSRKRQVVERLYYCRVQSR